MNSKQVIRVAYLGDPSREAVFYALQHGIVGSDSFRVETTPLELVKVLEAFSSREFDIIEATPLAIPRASKTGVPAVIVSMGMEDIDGTLFFVAANSGISSPSELKGRSVAVASFAVTSFLYPCYTLKRNFGLNVDLQNGDISFKEASYPEILPGITSGKFDCGITSQMTSFQALASSQYRVLYRPAREFYSIFGAYPAKSVLATYPETAQSMAPILREFKGLLMESLSYFHRNRDTVLVAVASESNIDPAYLKFWWDVYRFGEALDENRLRGIQGLWQAAIELGDITNYPEDLSKVIFE